MKIMVETSAHHVHVCRATLDALYGEGYQLTNKKDLSQPGQFACFEKVTVVGPRGEMTMSILGPERPEDQVEVSLTDARKLGVTAPVRESGNVAGTPGCKLVGPKGEVEIAQGIIAAQRHIHFDTKTAEENGFKDKQIVSVKVGAGTGRARHAHRHRREQRSRSDRHRRRRDHRLRQRDVASDPPFDRSVCLENVINGVSQRCVLTA